MKKGVAGGGEHVLKLAMAGSDMVMVVVRRGESMTMALSGGWVASGSYAMVRGDRGNVMAGYGGKW